MSEYGGAYKTTREWQEISAIMTALENGTAMPPAQITTIDEWLDFGNALRALEGIVGGGGTGTGTSVSTPTELNEALEDPALPEIILPSGTMVLDQVPWAKRGDVWLHGHADGTSKLFQPGDINDGLGTSHTIRIGDDTGALISNVRFSNFAVEHDRATSPDMRSGVFDLMNPCNNLWIHDITGTNLTSDFFIGRPYPWNALGCDGLRIHDIDITEIWEGVWNWHSGHLINARAWNVIVTASNQHAGYQGPMLFELNIEQTVGSVTNAEFSDSSFTLTGAAYQAAGILGLVTAANSSTGAVWYDGIRFHNVTINGAQYGGYFPAQNTSRGKITAASPKSMITLTDCDFPNCPSTIYIYPDSDESTAAKIVSNRCVWGGSPYSSAAWNTSFPTDQEVYCKVTNPATFILQIGLADVNDTNVTQWQLWLVSPTVAQIWKYWDQGLGTQYLKIGADIAISHSADDEWKLRRVGDDITVWQNGVLVDTRTDPDPAFSPGAGYVGFLIYDATTSIKDFGGGAVGSSTLLDSFTRADEDPLNPANWVNNGGWRTGSANDRFVYARCTGNTNPPVDDESRMGVNGPIAVVDAGENVWT